MLAQREYSQQEAIQKLMHQGYVRGDIDDVIDEYVQKGWLSNARFIDQKVSSLMARGYGTSYVQQVLRQQGVEIQASEYQWQEAYHVALRKAGKKEGFALKRYLYRRGFMSEMLDD